MWTERKEFDSLCSGKRDFSLGIICTVSIPGPDLKIDNKSPIKPPFSMGKNKP